MIATTTAVILGGTATDAYGDEVDLSVPKTKPFPVSLIRRTRSVQDRTSGMWRIVTYYTCRATGVLLDVTEDDRLRDETTGTIYAIDVVARTPRTIAGRASTLLELRDPRGA